jgi:hypothetical protein
LVSTARAGDATRAQAARKAVAGIGGAKDIKLLVQVRYALNELADATYGLPEPTRKLLTAMAEENDNRGGIADQALDEEAGEFVTKACGGATTADVKALTVANVILKCKLKVRKAVPAARAKSMRPAAVLLAAYVIDLLGASATEDERTIARWIAHYGRTDEATARPVKRP